MKYLLMNLDADRMSFGYNNNGNNRYTVDFPTKSVLFGMICCAMGKSGELPELFGKLRQIKTTAFSLTEKSRVETDFQTIGNGWLESDFPFKDKNTNMKKPVSFDNIGVFMVEHKIMGGKAECCTSLIDKDYLVNHHFIVLLEIPDDAFADEIANALKRPVWQMYIGRKKCIPCDKVFYGLFDTKEEALDVVDGMHPFYTYSEKKPDDYIDEANVRDVPMKAFNQYDSYTYRKVFKSVYTKA